MNPKCPHCGSEDGYFTPITEKWILVTYNGNSECGGASDIIAGRPKCLECRKNIPKKIIDALDEQ